MKNTSRNAIVEFPNPVVKIADGSMIPKMATSAIQRKLGQSVPTKFHMIIIPINSPIASIDTTFSPSGAGISGNSRINANATII